MDDFERELKEGFLEESNELLENAESSFLQLENDKDNPDLINEIFRLAHNLKGNSRAVGFGEVAELTHHAENLILKIKEGERKADNEAVSVLLEYNDRIKDMIDGLKEDFDATFDNAELISKIEAVLASGGSSEAATEEPEPEPEPPALEEAPAEASAAPAVEVDLDLLAEVEAQFGAQEAKAAPASDLKAASGTEIAVDCEALAEAAQEALETSADDIAEMAQKEADGNLKLKPEELKKKSETKPAQKQAKAKAATDESIRVSLSRIEKLNNIVGELVILQTVLDQRRFAHIEDELSNKSIGQLGKLSKEIQELSMSLRMVPVKTTFQKMTRIVRDTSKKLGKEVELKLTGEGTEIDKTVLENIGDPLVHIVRNAVDHGLEMPDDRKESGKSKKGNVEIKAFHEGSNLVIEVVDDGKGIDPSVIRRKAIEKGVIRENAAMSDQDVIQLIFHPGFSTKEQVTEVSGRGVGMDVVKTNIEALSGEVNVKSVVGKGSVFKIVLPLTLAIIEGMVIHCDDSKFILPLAQVHEFVRVDRKYVKKLSDGAELLSLRDEVMPFFKLINGLKLKRKNDLSGESIAIIIRAGDHPYAVEVDDIVNQQQVVIKNLGDEVRNRKGFMGSSILGDGKPAIIVDLVDMFGDALKDNPAYDELMSTIDEAA